MHFDRHENLNVQVYGRKRWVLFAPGQSANVYYRQRRDLPVIFSPVDMSDPDPVRFPRVQSAPRHDFVLEAGEVLYLPPGWWHYVESLSDSINVNYWWWSPRAVRTFCRVGSRACGRRSRAGGEPRGGHGRQADVDAALTRRRHAVRSIGPPCRRPCLFRKP